jgi:hypothetical protein
MDLASLSRDIEVVNDPEDPRDTTEAVESCRERSGRVGVARVAGVCRGSSGAPMAGACIDSTSDVEGSRLFVIAGEESIYPARGMKEDRLVWSIVVTGLGPVAPGCDRIADGRGDTSMATFKVDCPPSYETLLPSYK